MADAPEPEDEDDEEGGAPPAAKPRRRARARAPGAAVAPRSVRRRPAETPARDEDEAKEASASTAAGAHRVRRILFGAAALSVGGLFLVGTGPSDLGTAITVLGLLGLGYGVHAFGRLGPESV